MSFSSVMLCLEAALDGTSVQNAVPLVSATREIHVLSLTLYASLIREVKAALRDVCGILVYKVEKQNA